MNPARSDKKDEIYAHKAPRKTMKVISPLEKVGAGGQDMKEEDVVNKTERASYSTLRENGSTATNKFVKEKRLLCSTYDVSFRK